MACCGRTAVILADDLGWLFFSLLQFLLWRFAQPLFIVLQHAIKLLDHSEKPVGILLNENLFAELSPTFFALGSQEYHLRLGLRSFTIRAN